MKIKPLHVYLGIGVFAVVFLVIVALMQSSPKKDLPAVSENKEMPQDDVHKGVGTQSQMPPSKGNVSPEFLKHLDDLKTAADKNPRDTAMLKEYADLLAASHKQDEAIVYYEKILKVNPRRTDIRLIVASLYFTKEDYTKCEISLNSVLGYDKNNAHALFNLGVLAATKGENDKAKNIWNDLIKRNLDSKITDAAKDALKSLK